MKRCKILYLITGLGIGGAEIILSRLLSKLNKKKYEFIVVSITSIGKIGIALEKKGIKVLSLNAKQSFDFFVFFRLIKVVKKESPDILHTHLFHANFLGKIVGRLCGVPIIISTIHSTKFKNSLREKLSLITRGCSDMTVVISNAISEIMFKKGVILKGKYRVIRNGVDIEEFGQLEKKNFGNIKKELGIEHKSPILLSIGRLHEAKGHLYLIQAIKLIKKDYPNITLLIVGDGGQRDSIEKLIKKLSFENNILLLGEKIDIKKFFQIADIFVSSSIWEGLGISMIEAQIAKIPVVATNVGGIREVVEDNVSGFLVDPRKPKALAGKIKEVLSLSETKKQKIIEAARRSAVQKFSLKEVVMKHENLYQELLNKKNL